MTDNTTTTNSSRIIDDNDPTMCDDDHPLVVTTEALESYCDNVHYLWCSSGQSSIIPILKTPPSSLVFLRDYVAMSRPCIIRNTILKKQAQQAHSKSPQQHQQSQQPLTLSLDELVELTDPNILLTVDVTPDGHGDCLRMVKQQQQQQTKSGGNDNENNDESYVIQSMFVKPQERQYTLSEFRTLLRASQRHGWQKSVRGSGDDTSTIRYRVFQAAAPPPADSTCSNETADMTNHNNKSHDDSLHSAASSSVFYYSRQNDCLRTELGSLWEQQQDVLFPRNFPWAAQAFGNSSDAVAAAANDDDDDTDATATPDAINLWIGNEQAVSAMHKDHYENLFYVLHGEKIFTLCPPGDAPFLYEDEYPSGRFVQQQQQQKCCHSDHRDREDNDNDSENAGEWQVQIDPAVDDGTTTNKKPSTVHWIAANVMDDRIRDDDDHGNNATKTTRRRRFPLLHHAHPIQVRVQAGEMLYLPSLWFHQVTQTCETVAINYWYDMTFNSPLWCYFHLLSQLKSPGAAAPSRATTSTTLDAGTTTTTTTANIVPNDQKEQEQKQSNADLTRKNPWAWSGHHDAWSWSRAKERSE